MRAPGGFSVVQLTAVHCMQSLAPDIKLPSATDTTDGFEQALSNPMRQVQWEELLE
jgi:hypothetical protein